MATHPMNQHVIHTLMPLLLTLMVGGRALSQQSEPVHWLTFEQLDDSLQAQPKKVFVAFYADWCAYCRKMDKVAFRDERVVALLNTDYYAVRMNIETVDTITFGNQVFVNERINKPNPVHQIPWLMASRKGKPFSLPAMVMLDEKFQATARYFQYLNAEQMREVLD